MSLLLVSLLGALLAAAILSGALAFHIYRSRGAPGATLLVLISICMSVWALAYAFELGVAGLAAKVFFMNVKFLGAAALPPLWLAFALRNTGREGSLSPRNLALLALVPVLTPPLMWTNGSHGLVWSRVSLNLAGPLRTVAAEPGVWFLVFLAYSYGVLLLGAGVLISNTLDSRALYRKQSILLLVAALVPWISNSTNLAGRDPLSGLDLTPLAFPLSVAALYWAVSHLQMLDIFPVTRDAVMESMREGVIVLDSRYRVVDMNPAAERVLSCEAANAIGRTITQLTSGRNGILEGYRATTLLQRYREEGEAYEEVTPGTGTTRRVYALTLTSLRKEKERHGEHLMTLQDVTERRSVEDHLDRLAHYDTLTGLPNRRLFYERLERAVSLAERRKSKLAVLFLDLDHFKSVNDTLGHEIGDLLLQEVAVTLTACVRESDTVSRLAGDEFVVLLPDPGEVEEVARVARRIVETFAEKMVLEGNELPVTTSVGVSLYPADGHDRATLLKTADTAMYRAKTSGKNRFEFYKEEAADTALERLDLEGALQRALERGEFRVYYQPMISLKTGEVFGAEALARWEHPERGVLAPVDFIEVAENTGLIVPLGQLVMKAACEQMYRWNNRHPSNYPRTVSVNLSARQLEHPALVEDVARTLRETGLEPGYLMLEIPEDAALKSVDATRNTLERLKELGVKLTIDDFGTGYSSLPSLKRFPVDFVKIDRSLIAGLSEASEDKEVISALIGIAGVLGLKVIAEGVEIPQQLALLNRLGCDIVQGHYWSEALPPDRAEEAIRMIHLYFS